MMIELETPQRRAETRRRRRWLWVSVGVASLMVATAIVWPIAAGRTDPPVYARAIAENALRDARRAGAQRCAGEALVTAEAQWRAASAEYRRHQIGLLRRMGKGDTSALAELYDRVAPTLLGVIRRIVRDQAESEDVLQEVILQAWTRVQPYDPVRDTPFSWLVRIARNRAIDRYRSKRVKAHLEDPPVAPVHESAAGSMDDDPERAAVNAFDRRRLEEILASLPPEQRVLIEQAFFPA